MAPALLTLPSSERLRARVKASEEVEATEATAAICIVMASGPAGSLGIGQSAIVVRHLETETSWQATGVRSTIVNQHSLACGHPGTSL